MGATSSRIEEDKALLLCRERKKFVQKALDGRCSLAAAHITYLEALKATGTALREFVEPLAPVVSSLYTATSMTPGPLTLPEKSLSQISFSSPLSQRMDTIEHPSPSPPSSTMYQSNAMKFWGSFSRKVEEKPFVPVIGSVTSSTPQHNTHPTEGPTEPTFETSPISPGTPPWDYFGLFRLVNDNISTEEPKEFDHGMENLDDRQKLREEGLPDLKDEEKGSIMGREESQESEDDFDEPSTPMLVRSFENVARAADHVPTNATPTTLPVQNAGPEDGCLNQKKRDSPDLSPLRTIYNGVADHNDEIKPIKGDGIESSVVPKDFFSSMKDVELLFFKASESGRGVPRMLEANKFDFRPIFPGKRRSSMGSAFLKTCFSCGEDPSQVQEEHPQTSTQYLTWHRTMSSASSSSRNPHGANSKDEIEDFTSNLFDNFCMVSGSHASTLDRLYAWEKKLYDEVKASEMIRREYDQKCKLLRQLESNDEGFRKIDKTRALVKDLHSRLRVAVHRINRISNNIEELRDNELQPQLEELIDGLRKMWEMMLECHRLQVHVISVAHSNGDTKVSIQSDLHRQIAIRLESELCSLSSSFTKWIGAQKAYVEAINKWLFKCIKLPTQFSKRKNRMFAPHLLAKSGPTIYTACDDWFAKLNELPTKEVADSMKGLAAEIGHFLPRQEKIHGKGLNHHHKSASEQVGSSDDFRVKILRDESSEDWARGFDNFRVSLLSFLGQLNNYAESSVTKFLELQSKIQEAKLTYEQFKNSKS